MKKIGVVGVGHLGQRHLENLLKLKKKAFCSGFFDNNKETAAQVEIETGGKKFNSIHQLLDHSEAIIIAVPTSYHYKVAKLCLEADKHVFVEKPICTNIIEAKELIKLAKKKKLILQVGHVERLNPAILTLKETDIPLEPKYIETHRLAPYRIRGTEVPVVLDLMIHDLDVILSLVNYPVKNVTATGVSIMTNSVDIANARIEFNNGCVANITSSRVAKDYVRKLRLFEQEIYITIDFLQGLTEVYKVMDYNKNYKKGLISAPLEANGDSRQIVYEKLDQKKINALALELENFIAAIVGDEEPIVSGHEGLEALKLALEIQEKIELNLNI
ncbi:MAG: oxidoreductase [Candidatus Marinimicrobia bacterium]|nr:oxidoreductase [Candidatus Neomarinimicrobiota bacterium]|tara:strand:- start:54586 stop:55575 length:990 start_codon:yes stop_codon:yes gene_type:complete